MRVERVRDPAAFLEQAGPLLLADEARHNLMLGIAGALRDAPEIHDEHRLWVASTTAGEAAAAALQTPPFNLVLARPAADDALAEFARALHAEGVELPGVTAAVPEVDAFASEWERLAGVRPRRRMAQRVYRATEIRAPHAVTGSSRPAVDGDRELLVAWMHGFAREAHEGAESPVEDPERIVSVRLDRGLGGFLLWEVGGEAVSVAGWGSRTPNGVRVGPVYTPAEHRRRGYGSAATAAVSAKHLASGRRFCFLYTDLANATSNRIYVDIGYEPVCDSVDYAFDPV